MMSVCLYVVYVDAILFVDIVIVVDERVSITVSALNVGILQRMYCVSLSVIV